MMKAPDEEMVYAATLRTRFGLTPKLIRELGEPDKLVPNPNHKSGPPAKLYRLSRVNEFVAQHRSAIELLASRREARKASARKGVATKTHDLLAELDAVELVLTRPLPPFEVLRGIASSHAFDRYGAHAREPNLHGLTATVRHEFTNYDAVLRSMSGRVANSEGYEALRSRLDAMVWKLMRDAYPGEFVAPEDEHG